MKQGKKYGDEYLAELDYIEVAEAYKYGYESDVEEESEEEYEDCNETTERGDNIFSILFLVSY